MGFEQKQGVWKDESIVATDLTWTKLRTVSGPTANDFLIGFQETMGILNGIVREDTVFSFPYMFPMIIIILGGP